MSHAHNGAVTKSKKSWLQGINQRRLVYSSPFLPGPANMLPPMRPLAVVKRLIGLEPSVMRVDFSPRDCSIFTCTTYVWTKISDSHYCQQLISNANNYYLQIRMKIYVTQASTRHTCISGPARAMACSVLAPMALTMFLNLPVSMSEISRDLLISSSFCSLT